MELIVGPDGAIQMVHDDDVADLFEGEEKTTFRASHVEPSGAYWSCDLRPVGGPLTTGFLRRDEALSFEVEWLRVKMSNGKVEKEEKE